MLTSGSVTVIKNTLVFRLRVALSPADEAPAHTPQGAAHLQVFRLQFFDLNSSGAIRYEIKRIIGGGGREATADVESTTGSVVQEL